MLARRTRTAIGVLCGLGLLALPVLPATSDDKAKAPEARKPDLSKLPNNDLLNQARTVYDRGSGDYLAAARALAGIEAQLDDITRQLADLAPPEPSPKKADPKGKDAAEVAAKAAVDAARARADFAKQKLKLVQSRKQLQEKAAAAADGLQSAAGAFRAALDDLRPFAVEIALRFQDGTLAGPPTGNLLPETLAKKRKEHAAEEDKIRVRLADARRAVEAAAKSLEEAEKAVSATEAEATEAGRAFAREQQRRETEKKYAGHTPDRMLAELDRLVRDGTGLKGSYELAYADFTTRATGADRLRRELAALKPPDGMVPRIARAEDIQQAARLFEATIAFHNGRARKADELRAHLVALARSGGAFEADAAVSDDQLFQMQVLAGLLEKAGLADRLPEPASKKRLAGAVERAQGLAAEVRAATGKARADLPALEKIIAEARAAAAAATEQLAALRKTEEATLAAIRSEERLTALTAPQVVEEFNTLRKDITAKAATLAAQEAEFKRATAAADDARTRLAAVKDPLLRAAEEQGQAERQRLLAELRTDAGLDRAVTTIAPTAPSKPEEKEKEKKPSERKPDERERKPDPPVSPLDRVLAELMAFQQQLSARARVLEEREEKAALLLAALNDFDKKATAYSNTLVEARLAALRLGAAGVDIKKRVGRGELGVAKIPDGVTESLGADGRRQLDTDAAAVLSAIAQARQELDALRKPDPQADALKALSRELLGLVGRRIDLLNDLKRLATDYKLAAKDRPTSERKRLDQTAVDRMDRDAGRWDWFLAVDRSKQAASLSDLLEAYYHEVIEIEHKDENLRKQKAKIDELIDMTARERAVLQKATPALEQVIARLDAAREEEAVLARARVRPEAAEQLLKAYQAKTGRFLATPLPLGEQDRAAKVAELAQGLFERSIEVEAARRWSAVLAGRLGTAGLTAESGAFQDGLAELAATAGANARRVETLTGNPAPEPGQPGAAEQARLPAHGGEIGTTRGELNAVRTRGVQRIGIKVGAILLSAILLPRVVMFLLRRALGRNGAGNASMAMTAVGGILKLIVWVVAIALILSTLGFDVTAIVAALGIGGLAIGLAAQPMLADVIGAVIIFAERRFRIGDVVKLGPEEPARVIALTWRSTALKNSDGIVITVPNRKVTETAVQNLTRAGHTYDSLSATVTTDKDMSRVLEVIKRAMEACENLSPDHGVTVRKFTHKGTTRVGEYRFWWFLKDYESRNRTRDEVFARIGVELAHEDMVGTEVTLA